MIYDPMAGGAASDISIEQAVQEEQAWRSQHGLASNATVLPRPHHVETNSVIRVRNATADTAVRGRGGVCWILDCFNRNHRGFGGKTRRSHVHPERLFI